MRLRELTKRSGSSTFAVWPPKWAAGSGPGEISPYSEDGVLRAVKRVRDEHGEHLTLIKRIGVLDYTATLAWDGPPTLAAVETALEMHPGMPIRKLGDLEV